MYEDGWTLRDEAAKRNTCVRVGKHNPRAAPHPIKTTTSHDLVRKSSIT